MLSAQHSSAARSLGEHGLTTLDPVLLLLFDECGSLECYLRYLCLSALESKRPFLSLAVDFSLPDMGLGAGKLLSKTLSV